jgi:hypothetical protein
VVDSVEAEFADDDEPDGYGAITGIDVWAVGDNSGQGITMHWNGSTWATIPNSATGYVYINAVSATASIDVWAVGSSGSSYRTLVMPWNGAAWTQLRSESR